MSRRKDDKYKLIEGRGQYQRDAYVPRTFIHEFGSKGRARKAYGWKHKRVWQSGKLMNSLLSDHSNCGGSGKSRDSNNKLGRPRKFGEKRNENG